jgi:hypothetical protein
MIPVSSGDVPAQALRNLQVPRVPVFLVDASMPPPSLEALVSRVMESVLKVRVIVVSIRLEEKPVSLSCGWAGKA